MPVVCVTGATSGIGRATVERFVKEGWEAVALGRREERLAALAAEHPGHIRTARLDVRDRDEVERAFKDMGCLLYTSRERHHRR